MARQMVESDTLTSYPLVSIVILNYNGKRFILDCVRTVLGSNYPHFEVILVDNCSEDDSIGLVEKEYGLDPRLTVVPNHGNFGYALGNNVGLAHSKGDLIIFLNSDTQVDSEWLGELAKIFSSRAEVGVAQSVLLQMRDKQSIQSTGTFLTSFGWPRSRPRIRTSQDALPSILACGAAFMIRRDIIDKVGGFDPDYFIDFEDVDLSLRVWLSGRRVVLAEKSLVYHYDPSMHAKDYVARQTPLREFHSSKNVILTLVKNFEFKNVLRFLPATFLFTLCRGLYVSVREGNPGIFSHTIRGMSWPISNLGEILRRRNHIQNRIRTVPDEYVLKNVCSLPDSSR